MEILYYILVIVQISAIMFTFFNFGRLFTSKETEIKKINIELRTLSKMEIGVMLVTYVVLVSNVVMHKTVDDSINILYVLSFFSLIFSLSSLFSQNMRLLRTRYERELSLLREENNIKDNN